MAVLTHVWRPTDDIAQKPVYRAVYKQLLKAMDKLNWLTER